MPWSYAGGAKPGVFPKAGLVDLSNHSRLELTGEDRCRFLGGLVTCAVSDLEDHGGTYGFITTIKGKALADVVISAFPDRLFLLLPPERAEPVREHLEKYVVADRVEILPLGDLLPFALLGSEIQERLPAGVWPENPWGCGVVDLFGTQVPVSRHERLGVPALIAWVSSGIVEPVVSEWVKELELELVGGEVLDWLRVERGLPAFGVDYDQDSLVQESGIEAVDFTKGCYLGQEVIARLHYRGKLPKVVRRVALPGGESDLALPAELEFDGRPAGLLTTISGNLGLGMVQRRAAEPGTIVSVGSPSSQVSGTIEVL